jgi:hypothetical protein
MKYVFIFSFAFLLINCRKKENTILPLIPKGIEVQMVGKWKQYGDTMYIARQNGSIDTILFKAIFELKDDLSFTCKEDPWFMNRYDSIATGRWAHDTLKGYNTINLFVDIKNGNQITFPDNSIYWVVWPSTDTLLVSQHADIQLGYTSWSYRKFKKE